MSNFKLCFSVSTLRFIYGDKHDFTVYIPEVRSGWGCFCNALPTVRETLSWILGVLCSCTRLVVKMERSGVASCSHGVDDWNDLLRVITLRNIAAAARENCSKSNGDPARLRANSSLRSSEESREQLPSSGCTYGQPLGASRGLDNPASGQNVSGFKPQREYSRPSCSYTCLIGMALLTSSSGSLTVSDIYKSIE